MLGNSLTFPTVFVHDLNVHLGLDMAVEMMNSFKLYPTKFTLIGSLSGVDPHVIFQIVTRAEFLVAHFTVVLLGLVFLLDMTPEVGGRPRSEATLLTKIPLAKVQRPMGVKLAGVGEAFITDVAGKILLIPVAHHVELEVLSFHEPLVTRLTVPGLHLMNLLHVLYEISCCGKCL